jgi:hypothetical protein
MGDIVKVEGDTGRYRKIQGDSEKIQGVPRDMQGDLGCEIL